MGVSSLTPVSQILKRAASEWLQNKAPQQGAALAFYGVLSLAPLLLLSLSIASVVFDRDAARAQIVEQMRGLVGTEGGRPLKRCWQMLVNLSRGALPPCSAAYGAAGSLVVLVVWIYYSAQIFLLGAEVTQAYADRFGSSIVPKRGAELVSKDRHE